MNKKKIDQALAQESIRVVVELNLLKSHIKNEPIGNLYTFYSRFESNIKIGYTSKIELIDQEKDSNHFKLIEKKAGKKREEKLLKQTLEELGFRSIDGVNTYKYSPKLIKYLNLLGWPTGELSMS